MYNRGHRVCEKNPAGLDCTTAIAKRRSYDMMMDVAAANCQQARLRIESVGWIPATRRRALVEKDRPMQSIPHNAELAEPKHPEQL
jgi:hypothetical protein